MSYRVNPALAGELAEFGGETATQVLQLRQLHGRLRAFRRGRGLPPQGHPLHPARAATSGSRSRRSRGSATTAAAAPTPARARRSPAS